MLLVAMLVAAVSVSCSRSSEDTRVSADALTNGEQIYASMCKKCHGARGEGGAGPSLRDIDKGYDEATLVSVIDSTMPLREADKCDRRCAEDVGGYIYRAFRGPIVCEGPEPTPREQRLLTRREYYASVRDLLGVDVPALPPPPCGVTTFRYDPHGRPTSSVHVAGELNGWPQTIAAGGWPLSRGGDGIWSITRTLPQGSHAYKLVLDEATWIRDPNNNKTTPDGLGGENSVLEVTCAPKPGLPADTRPEGFSFDDHGPGRIVTTVLAEEQFQLATSIAAAADLTKIVPCDRADRQGCTTQVLRDFGRRALRRPLTDAELTRYRGVASRAGDFDAGIRAGIRALLVSPSFLYRSEVGEARNGGYHLTPWEVSAALSFFFWGTTPDDALLDAAASGELATPAGIEAHARRLLASPRARETFATFAEQWLGIEAIGEINKAEAVYPFPAALRQAMREETRRFVTHVAFDGSHQLGELFTADYTFVNGALAHHYGMPAVKGSEFQRVTYADPYRSGILGHASVHATTGHSDQTSPIRRGLFVRRRLLCQEFAPPPPNAGGVPAIDPNATTRERFAQHSASSACRGCHKYIDSVGFGFERFDTIGRLRDTEAGRPIDSLGDMNDLEGLGTNTHASFESMRELGGKLASSNSASACVTRQAWRFARGRVDDDICFVRPIEERFRASGGDLRELLIAIVTDPAFVVRK